MRPAIWLLLVLLPVCVQAAPTRYQILADTTTIKADDLLQVLGRADIDSAQIDTLYGTVFMPAGSRLTAAAIDADSLIGAFISTGAGTFNAGIVVPDGQRVTAEAVDADSLIGGTIIPAGVRLTAAAIDADSLINAVRLTGLATFAAGLTVPAAQTVTGSAGSIFDLTAVTPDSILGTVLNTGVHTFNDTLDIATAAKWQLANVSYTGSMANLNTLVDSLVASYAWRSKLTASDGTPNPAVQVDAAGLVGIGGTPQTTLDVLGVSPVARVTASGTQPALQLYSTYSDATERNWELRTSISVLGAFEIRGGSAQTIAPNVTRLMIDRAGNVGIGVVPNTWAAGTTAQQWGGNASLFVSAAAAAGNYISLMQNAYYDGNYKRMSTDEASNYTQINGTHAWRVAVSGTAGDAFTFTDAMTLTNAGQLLVGTATASANAAGPSLLIAQGANDDGAIVLSSTDVSQPVTTESEAGVYAKLGKAGATFGGLRIVAHNDADATLGANALRVDAISGDVLVDSTDTASSTAPMFFNSYQTDGSTGDAALSAAENAVVWYNYNSAIMLLKGGGVLHLTNATPSALDRWDDRHLVRALERQRSAGVLMSKWDALVQEGTPELIEAGVLSSDGSMLKVQPMLSLLGGASWQNTTDIYEIEEYLDTDVDPRLTALERRVNEQAMQLSWRDLRDTATALSRN